MTHLLLKTGCFFNKKSAFHTDLEGTVALLASARYTAHIFLKYTIFVTIIDEKQNNLTMNIHTIAILKIYVL